MTEILAEPQMAAALNALDRCLARLGMTDRVDQPMLDELRRSLSVLDPSAGSGGLDHIAQI